jgi:type II secretory pathway pseudopilin PulG
MAISDGRFRGRHSERGFTLAGLIVIMTIMAMVLAYTVPRMWSDMMNRERELQTIFVIKQYARAIEEFQRKRGALPVSIEQLKEQNRPRVVRQLWADPLTGKMDWVLIAPGAPGAPVTPGATSIYSNPSPQNPNWGQKPPSPDGPPANQPGGGTAGTPVPPGTTVGAFVGVRPGKTGKSMISFRGQNRFEAWTYTLTELAADGQLAAGPH